MKIIIDNSNFSIIAAAIITYNKNNVEFFSNYKQMSVFIEEEDAFFRIYNWFENNIEKIYDTRNINSIKDLYDRLINWQFETKEKLIPDKFKYYKNIKKWVKNIILTFKQSDNILFYEKIQIIQQKYFL